MSRIFARIVAVVRIAFYLSIGIFGVVVLAQGQPIGWIAVGLSGGLIALRILSLWLRRRQAELVAREAARRAEPGYVAPIIDPAELSRRRTRYMTIIVLMCIGPFITIAIVATWIGLVYTGGLQAYWVVVAIAMLLSAGATLLGLRRSFRKIRENG